MKSKVIMGIMLTMLFVGMLPLAFYIQCGKATGTVYIRADGMVDPSIAPIQRDGNVYTFTGNINASIVVERDNIVVDGAGYTVQGAGSEYGIDLIWRSNVTIKNMEIEEFRLGIRLQESENNTIYGNTIRSNYCGIDLFSVGSPYSRTFNNTISMNNIENNNFGVVLTLSSSITLYENVFNNNIYNFLVKGTEVSYFMHSIDVSNLVDGKPVYYLLNQTDFVINSATHPQVGYLALVNCANVTVEGLSLTNNGNGLLLAHTNNSRITDNSITNNYIGISLESSSNNTLRRNSVANNEYNFDVYGSAPSDFVNDVDTSNTVDGKPVYYWINEQAMAVPLDAGYVVLVNCTNITVQNLNLTDNYQGALLAYTTNSTIAKNKVTNNFNGIIMRESMGNIIFGNNIKNNSFGIYLRLASNSTISGNNIENNYFGISVWGSTNNTISGNNMIANNGDGIAIRLSSNNTIYHNNFIENTQQVYSGVSANDWDHGFEGNYWSDYRDKYPNATELDGLGIWDTPYVIDENNQDNYPLMNPYSPVSKTLLVPYEAQGVAPWCWAASTSMILRYYGKPVHLWDIGKVLTPSMIFELTAIETYIHKYYPSEFETEIGSYSSISDRVREDVEGNLSRGYPILLHVDPPGPGTHMVVVTGYNSSGFFINDPSGALFTGFESSASYPYIHEFATWEELQPLIFKELSNDVFLVVKGIPSPVEATLFLNNVAELGIRTVHDSDSEKGVYIDYGGWWWFLGPYWRHIGGHPIAWDLKDTLNFHYEIFNYKGQEAIFDFRFQVIGEDQGVYYEKIIQGISVPSFHFGLPMGLEIPLKDYLIKGQRYMVIAEISYHGSQEVIDSITLPPIYYGVSSIMFTAECPVRMLVTDPDGLRVGFDSILNQTINEIPNALYYYGNGSEPEVISIPNQKIGNYSVTVFGIESGTYNFTCTTLNETGFLLTENFINKHIEESESQIYIIPEFPSCLILPLFMIATLLAVTVYRRKHPM